MTDVHAVARDQLLAFITRIERLEEEKKSIADDIKDVYGEAKGTGFDTKILREVIKIRKQDRDERAEREAILDSYLIALGMIEQPSFFDDEPVQAAPAARQPAMALRSDGGLSILTKHEDIRIAPVTAEENTRPATLAVSGGEPSVPSSDAGGEKMDGCNHPGRSDDESAYLRAKSVQATNTILPDTANETMGGTGDDCSFGNRGVWPPQGGASSSRGNDNLSVVTAGETAASTDQPGDGGAHEIEGSAPSAGCMSQTPNNGEGAPCALPAKSSIRPLCRNPGETCGGYGRKHCRTCEMAAAELEAAE